MYITSYSIRIVLLSRYVNIYDTMAPMSDADDNLVYKPPPLDEVWLDAEGCEQSKVELRQQRKRNEELMRNREVATKDLVQTPVTQSLRGATSQIILYSMVH